MDAEKILKINKLAKSLKDTGIARSMDDAVRMAEKMVSEGELPLKETVVKGEFLEEPEEVRKEPFILKKPEEKPEEMQEEISDLEDRGV